MEIISLLLISILPSIISLFITFIYINIFIFLFKRESIKSNSKRKVVKWSIIILTFSNVIVWLPFSILRFILLFTNSEISKFYYDLIIVFIVPLNAILNPIIFIASDIQIFRKERKEFKRSLLLKLIHETRADCLSIKSFFIFKIQFQFLKQLNFSSKEMNFSEMFLMKIETKICLTNNFFERIYIFHV